MEYYGGLSGAATGAAAYFCLCRFFKADIKRGIWLAILSVMLAKIAAEAVMNEPIFAHANEIPFRILPQAHIVGYLGALTAVIWAWPALNYRNDKGKK